METNKFEQLKNKAKEISLTHKEKAVLRSNIESFMKYHPIQSTAPRDARVKSPFSPFMLFARSVAFVLIGMLAGGSGLAYASEQALPGDALYSLKVNVTEEVVGALSFTSEAKLDWETERIIRRIDEIQKIEDQKSVHSETLNKDKDIALKSFEKSLDRFNQKAEELKYSQHRVRVLEATENIEIKLKAQGSTEDKENISVIMTTTATENEQKIPVETPTTSSSRGAFIKGEYVTRSIKAEYARIENEKINQEKPTQTEGDFIKTDTGEVVTQSIENDRPDQEMNTQVRTKPRIRNNIE